MLNLTQEQKLVIGASAVLGLFASPSLAAANYERFNMWVVAGLVGTSFRTVGQQNGGLTRWLAYGAFAVASLIGSTYHQNVTGITPRA